MQDRNCMTTVRGREYGSISRMAIASMDYIIPLIETKVEDSKEEKSQHSLHIV